jgi:tetratricopeptide (TPR) repeat protein
MDKGKAAQGSKNYDEALTDYQKAEDIKGDREKEAEDGIATVNSLKIGMTVIEVAQTNYKQADEYLAQKQWERAESLYRLVKNTNGAPPALRNSSAEKELLASAHVAEEALFTQANSARLIDPKGAKVLYQKVVAMKLDHQQEAAKAIQEIDAEIAKGDLLRFLSNQTRILIDRGDAQSLQEAKQKYQEFLKSGGQDTTGLGAGIRDRENQVQDAAERGKKIQQEQEERARFDKAVADFEAARLRKDTGALNGSIKEEFQKLVDGRGGQALAANDYVEKKIPAAVLALTPPPPPAIDDRVLIAGVLDRYKDAYNHKSIGEMKSVWLDIPKGKLSELDLTFKNASIEYSLKYDKASFQLSGDGKSATAVATFTVRMIQLGEKKNFSGELVFSLRNENNQWYIINFQ